MTKIVRLVYKNIKIAIINVLHMFKKVKHEHDKEKIKYIKDPTE